MIEVELLTEWNPWWENSEVPEKFRGKTREIYQKVMGSLNSKEISIITGVRRSGKSTLMYQMVSNLILNKINPKQILFINLEDPKLSQSSLDEIYETYKLEINPDNKAYIFFDEIHKKEDWVQWIRKKYDLKTNDKFTISSSSSHLLKGEYSTLLTGRNLTFEIWPLTFKEFLDFSKIKIDQKKISKDIITKETKRKIIKTLDKYLQIGGFPAVFFEQDLYKSELLKQYFEDIIHKDIIDRYEVKSGKIKDLAIYLITNLGATASLRNLRNSIKISYDTIKDYLEYFKEAFLLFSLDYFSYSLKEQKTKPSKIYCIDNGLRNAVAFKFSEDHGKLAENLVFLTLKTKNKETYYWKNEKDIEVDFVIKENKDISVINVSYTNEIKEREIKGIEKIRKEIKNIKSSYILTKNIEKEERGIKFIPLWKWLLTT